MRTTCYSVLLILHIRYYQQESGKISDSHFQRVLVIQIIYSNKEYEHQQYSYYCEVKLNNFFPKLRAINYNIYISYQIKCICECWIYICGYFTHILNRFYDIFYDIVKFLNTHQVLMNTLLMNPILLSFIYRSTKHQQ